MRKHSKLEILYGLFALALIYIIINNNASITGFVISPGAAITPVSPADSFTIKANSGYFIFAYPTDFQAQECSLIMNDKLVKKTTALLSPTDTRIRTDLTPGTYYWKIQCVDNSSIAMESPVRLLTITSADEPNPELKITKFSGQAGYLYSFTLHPDLEIQINNVVPNDIIQVKSGENTYSMSILRIIQDYTKNIQYSEILVTPGSKRLRIDEGSSAFIDFNNDGKDDLKLTLDSVSYGKAYLTASNKQETPKSPGVQEPSIIISPVQSTQEQAQATSSPKSATQQEPATLISATESKSSFIVLLLIGVIVVLIIAIISTIMSKVEKEKKYLTELKTAPIVQEQKTSEKKRTARKKIKKKVKKKKKAKKIAKKKNKS